MKAVSVDSVEKDSAAAASGLQKGDLIIGINNTPIASLGDLRKAIDAKPPVLALNIQRGNDEIYLLLRNTPR